ncbi:MAG: hypothetical protein ACKO23_04040 [Gemmataceae bacterium]
MHVSRCRFWWCGRCRIFFEKENLPARMHQWAAVHENAIPGSRTCGTCGSIFALRDIFAGRHDVPEAFRHLLPPPVEIDGTFNPGYLAPDPSTEAPPSRFSAFLCDLLFLLTLLAGLAALAYFLGAPLLRD